MIRAPNVFLHSEARGPILLRSLTLIQYYVVKQVQAADGEIMVAGMQPAATSFILAPDFTELLYGRIKHLRSL